MTFESDVVPEYWRSAVIVPLFTGKGHMTARKKERGISLLENIYLGIQVD